MTMRTTTISSGAALAVLGLLGCGHGGTGAVTEGPLSVHAVNWNPDGTDLGKVAAVTDLSDSAVVFSDKGMSAMLAGSVTGTDATVTSWASAGVIPAADSMGSWLVGLDTTGNVYTVDANGQLSNISDRYGLLGQKVHDVASLGGSDAAFRLDGQLAIADGINVTQYALTLASLAGAKGRAAGVSPDGTVHVFDLASGQDSAIPLPGAAFVTFDNDAKVVAATAHALYGEDASGHLDELIDLSGATIHGLAGAPSGVWVAIDTELGLLTGTTLGKSSGAMLPADAVIAPSSSGDVWAISGGALTRYSAISMGDQAMWQEEVLPVFTRVCSQCHLPGGAANIDLSYYGAWLSRRALVKQRVFDKMPTPMPPTSASVMLTSADLAALQAWVNDG